MDKAALLDQIKNSRISAPFKKELLKIVEAAPTITDEIMQAVNVKLDEYANSIIEEMGNLEIQGAAREMNKQLDSLDKEADKFNKALNKKADEIDLKAVRSNLA